MINDQGYMIIARAVPDVLLREVTESIELFGTGKEIAQSTRNLLERAPVVATLARSQAIRALVEPILGSNCFAVRGILFDKTPAANWKVPWQQDLSIAVKQRVEIEGYGPWSVKHGVTHVQPPVEVLEQMVTVRLSVDDCFADNGRPGVV